METKEHLPPQMAKIQNQLFERANFWHDQMNQYVGNVMKDNPELQYQDVVNMFFLLKLAELDYSLTAVVKSI